MPEANHTAEAAGFKTVGYNVWLSNALERVTPEDGLIASPPCQTFSQAGKGAGRSKFDRLVRAIETSEYRSLAHLSRLADEVGDARHVLPLLPMYYAKWMEPRWIAFEQVPAVLPLWEVMAARMREWGYSVWTGVLYAEQYGVPQTRRRAFLIASGEHEVGAPVPTHSRYYPRSPEKLDPDVKPWVSMAEALGWSGEGYMRSNYGTGGDPAARGERDLSGPAPTITSKIDRNKWVHRRPSPTIVGSFRPEVVAAPGWRKAGDGPRQNTPNSVRVSVQEAGVLQSFPADYPWQGSKTKQYLQVGNAVPPLLAEAVLSVTLYRQGES